ncbi:hypothetical protein BDK51DRAFT_30212 [Blyttiomyces helicus]|uniref:Uncharacterized protein n=1 Tax=Blyttiomyces helicus TaxID=388810 RepID=A0A4P9W8W8_9FUNG|nr:hypothetical protein BDK51DRAFT_30212 [Blyttiomyces helicus]|eukprot:RKO88979.1 hypothetical protein BDK51DRAFT_30212 [Blyttiomyces helicus]
MALAVCGGGVVVKCATPFVIRAGTAKMMIATRAVDCLSYRMSVDLFSFLTLSRDHHMSLRSAADLAFGRDFLNSEEPLLHRIASENCRHAIALAQTASDADRLATHSLWHRYRLTGELLDEVLPILRETVALVEESRVPPVRTDLKVPFGPFMLQDPVDQRNLREAILDRALHMPGSACDMCAAPARGCEALAGTIVKLHGPEIGGRWRFVHIGSDTPLGNGTLINGDAIVLVVPINERDQLINKAVAVNMIV